jgi:hypothetical protein
LVNFPGMTLAIRPGYGPMVEAIDEISINKGLVLKGSKSLIKSFCSLNLKVRSNASMGE